MAKNKSEDSLIPYEEDLEQQKKDTENVIDHNLTPSSSEKVSKKVGDSVEEAAKELNISLPDIDAPFMIRVVALLMLVGGLSSLGGMLADIFRQSEFELTPYLMRIFGGAGFVAVSYGLYHKLKWSLWLFFLLVVAGGVVNYQLALLPGAIWLYLFFERSYFDTPVQKKLS